MYPSYIFLRSQDDPEAAGPAVVDEYNLDPLTCIMNSTELSVPHNLVLWATSKRIRARYNFAMHMWGRALWNKKYLHFVNIPCPSKAFPLWTIRVEHLLSLKERLFAELAYDTAIVCMEVFVEIVEQAYRNQLIDNDTLQKYLAIGADIPINRRNESEELAKIVQTSLAECRMHHFHDLISRRDSMAVIMAYIAALTPVEAARLTTQHIQHQEFLEGLPQHILHIPTGKYIFSQRIVPLGYTATAFLEVWLSSVYGIALFCEKSQFPDCQSGHRRLYPKILERRLMHIMKQPPSLEAFRQNYSNEAHKAYESGVISSTTRKLLLGHTKLSPEDKLKPADIQRLREFHILLEDQLGWWEIPLRKQ